jgi:hypothetical protein
MTSKEFWDNVNRAQRMIFSAQFEPMTEEQRKEVERRAYLMVQSAVTKRQELPENR